MRCEICGKEYRLLANHVWQAHRLSVREYKIQYNFPLSKALADKEWVERMKDIGNEQKETEKGRTILRKLQSCGLDHANKIKDGLVTQQTPPRREWPECSRVKMDKIGKESKKKLMEQRLRETIPLWSSGVPIRELPVSSTTATKWVKEGVLPKRKRKVFHKRKET